MIFEGKKVIVTGANRSIGKHIALALAEEGAEVVISYRRDEVGAMQTQKALQVYQSKALAFFADFSSMENVAVFARQALDHLGHVDILINNAGMLCRETFFDLAVDKLQEVFQVNSLAPLYLSQLCVESMLAKAIKGCIINISSIAATMTMSRGIGYAASKAAMNKWTENAAFDLAPKGIRVNAIAPGVIESGMNQDTKLNNPQLWEDYLNRIPLKRTGKPEDIVNMALFLASDKADWITGKVFQVDGGHAL